MIYVGLLGGGVISATHARAALETEGVEVSAVCGQNREKVARLCQSYGGTAYDSLQAFLRHKPMDLVMIGSPSGLHAKQGIAAARSGLHVLVEKPIDITTERADALTGECERAGVKLGVMFQDRVAPDICRLKGLVDAGALGKPILASGRVKWYRPPEYYGDSRWRGTWALDGGGALMNQGVHTVDLLLWLMGGVKRVSARAVTALHNIEVEDTVVATLEFTNGAVGTLEAATSVYPGSRRHVELTGTNGTIMLEDDRIVAADLRTPVVVAPPPTQKSHDPDSASPGGPDIGGHKRVLEDFLRAIETNSEPRCDGCEGRRSVELVQAVYESSRTGRAVKLTT